ncbi:MAG: heavy metal-associated domain-containing protein [Kiritimatiellae bacterium]|nr:heavy metal-associated domain-containing protein [Kiritimatiellia bacterium]MDD4735706.1 heavy metal-associated domain-containing protein [Kiritimatiellia bacterium]
MKTGILTIFACLLLLSFSTACFRKNVQTLEVQVPAMHTEACAALIKNAFAMPEGAMEGILQVETDVASKKVYVTYDSRKIAIKNIEYTICHLGFEANGQLPRPEEKNSLPEACR